MKSGGGQFKTSGAALFYKVLRNLISSSSPLTIQRVWPWSSWSNIACELQQRINNKGQKVCICYLSKKFLRRFHMTIPLSLLWLQGRLGNVVLILSSHRHNRALVITREERNGCWGGSFLPTDTAIPVLGNFPTYEWHMCQYNNIILVILHLSFQL